jgi:hypothetical protein
MFVYANRWRGEHQTCNPRIHIDPEPTLNCMGGTGRLNSDLLQACKQRCNLSMEAAAFVRE